MLLNEINHKMPIYKDCTLGEILAVGISALIVMMASFGLLTYCLFGLSSIGLFTAILLVLPISKLLLIQLQKRKLGKPYGYFIQQLRLRLNKVSILSTWLPFPFITRVGRWSVRRAK